jgi:hypothetical protein
MPQSMKVLTRSGIQPKRKPYDSSRVPIITVDKVLPTILPPLLLGLRDGDPGSN